MEQVQETDKVEEQAEDVAIAEESPMKKMKKLFTEDVTAQVKVSVAETEAYEKNSNCKRKRRNR
jgi:hypothetical protein